MDLNDFQGSFAQENVQFQVKVLKTATLGDNFWKAMIFVESDRFVDTSQSDWEDVPGTTKGAKACSVNVDTYATATTGLLQSWLTDLFANGFKGECILVAYAAKADTADDRSANLDEAYSLMKAYAYFKTILDLGVGYTGQDSEATDLNLDTTSAVAFAKLCAVDKGLLSSAPLFPYATQTPDTPSSDTLYAALNAATVDAFMSCYADTSRNTALFTAGLAMSLINNSGTSVGNSFDMIKTSNLASSGPGGAQLPIGVRRTLKGLNIQTFKPVGNNTGNVAAIGAETLQGDVVQATWILSYITYMVKVKIAELMTEPNFLKNEANYSRILSVLNNWIGKFGTNGSGRLRDIVQTPPSFKDLPESKGDEIIIPNAWSAWYVDQVRQVSIDGTLYLSV